METGKALPERHMLSNTANGLPDAQIQSNNSKPNPTTQAENSKPFKAKKEKPSKTPQTPKGPTPSKAKKELAAKPSAEDPESMFKVGFLSDVYQERPVRPEGITKVITRCKTSIRDRP